MIDTRVRCSPRSSGIRVCSASGINEFPASRRQELHLEFRAHSEAERIEKCSSSDDDQQQSHLPNLTDTANMSTTYENLSADLVWEVARTFCPVARIGSTGKIRGL